MCVAPITIKNPWFGKSHVGHGYLHDCKSQFIKVPCGSCQQCISMRQSFVLQRVQMESLRSHIFMLTLTYNDESLVYTDCGEYQVAVPHFPDFQNMVKRLRAQGHRFRYLICSEYGKLRFRPHFHALIAVEKSDNHFRTVENDFYNLFSHEWRRNYGSCRTPIWKPLFTPIFKRGRCTTFDFHYVEPVMDHDNDCSYYVTKYVTKYDKRTSSLLQKIKLDPDLTSEEISDLSSLIKPKRCCSKSFGDKNYPLIRSKILSMASHIDDRYLYPQYFDIYTGQQGPMSPYYGRDIPGFEKAYDRFVKFSEDDDCLILSDDNNIIDFRHISDDFRENEMKFHKNMKDLFDRCDF